MTPGELAELDQAVATATTEVNHYMRIYAAMTRVLPTMDALEASAAHILNDHNRGLSEEGWAAELAIAVRLLHEAHTELVTLKATRRRPHPARNGGEYPS